MGPKHQGPQMGPEWAPNISKMGPKWALTNGPRLLLIPQ